MDHPSPIFLPEHPSRTDVTRHRLVEAVDMALRTDGKPAYLVLARDTVAVNAGSDIAGPVAKGGWHEVDRQTWLDACRIVQGDES